jgi:tetratricopeptide (TPR) repeat protein
MRKKASSSSLGPSVTTTSLSPRSPWILDRWRDLLLVVATPLLVLPLLHGAQRFWTAEQITAFAIVMAMGHHLPGFIRAYGDRELFRRFRLRFLLAPPLLLAVTVPTTLAGVSSIVFVTVLWGTWHYLAQTYGFARIYDARMGHNDRLTARLDKALCFSHFFGAGILQSNATHGFLEGAVQSGMPAPSWEVISAARQVVLVVLVVVTGAWLANLVRTRRTPQSTVKIALLVSTLSYVWVIASVAANIYIAYALFEIFHDVQYLAIVWAFNRTRVARGQDFGALSRMVFRPGLPRAAIYVGLCAAYGLVDLAFKQSGNETVRRAMLGVFGASTLLHYYFDGFIWRLRDGSTRASLGIEGKAAAPWFERAKLRHAAMWALFAVPAGVLLFLETRTPSRPRDEVMAAALPDSYVARHNLGYRYATEGRFPAAIEHYRAALAVHPGSADTHYALAGALLLSGDKDGALAEYTEAVACNPRRADARMRLGIALGEKGRVDESAAHLEVAASLAPRNPEIAFNLGMTRMRQGRVGEAQSWMKYTLALDPGCQPARRALEEWSRQPQGVTGGR